MKSSSTIHLEEKFWELIRNYQLENKLSSRNDAIQLILTEWELLKRIGFSRGSVTDETIDDDIIKDPVVEEEEEVDPMILSGLMEIKNTMKE